jgi:hypothetical protein
MEHLDDAAAVDVRDDRGDLAAPALVGLVERPPPRTARLAARFKLVVGARAEAPRGLVARGALTARHLGVGGPAAHPLERAP